MKLDLSHQVLVLSPSRSNPGGKNCWVENMCRVEEVKNRPSVLLSSLLLPLFICSEEVGRMEGGGGGGEETGGGRAACFPSLLSHSVSRLPGGRKRWRREGGREADGGEPLET